MSKLSFLTEMKPGEDIEKCNIWKVLREGFGTFRTNFDSLVDLSDNMIMVRRIINNNRKDGMQIN